MYVDGLNKGSRSVGAKRWSGSCFPRPYIHFGMFEGGVIGAVTNVFGGAGGRAVMVVCDTEASVSMEDDDGGDDEGEALSVDKSANERCKEEGG